MPTVKNASARPITIDSTLLSPGMEAELADEVMEWKSVKAMVEAKELEVVKKAPPAPPAGTAAKA